MSQHHPHHHHHHHQGAHDDTAALILALQQEVLSMRAEMASNKQETVTLRSEITSLRTEVHFLQRRIKKLEEPHDGNAEENDSGIQIELAPMNHRYEHNGNNEGSDVYSPIGKQFAAAESSEHFSVDASTVESSEDNSAPIKQAAKAQKRPSIHPLEEVEETN